MFANYCALSRIQFNNSIHLDECCVQLDRNCNMIWHKKFDDETRGGLIGRYSKLMSVHIIGGISRLGPTSLEIWDGLLDSYGFQQMLARFCVPFVNNNYPNSHLLMMDNATIHTSPETNEFLLANNLNHFPTPPQSPDLNPIGIFSGPFSFLLILIQLFN